MELALQQDGEGPGAQAHDEEELAAAEGGETIEADRVGFREEVELDEELGGSGGEGEGHHEPREPGAFGDERLRLEEEAAELGT